MVELETQASSTKLNDEPGEGDDVILGCSTFAQTLLLETLAQWTDAMLPCFASRAQSQWGDEWEGECADYLSANMKQRLKMGCGWDAYRIASIIMIKPAIFVPNYDKLSDCAKEIYRQMLTTSVLISADTYMESCGLAHGR